MKNEPKTGFSGAKNPQKVPKRGKAESLHPHKPQMQALNRVSQAKGRTGDREGSFNSMRKYTIPVIRTNDPKKWYIEFYYQVPPDLREYFPKDIVRFKKYGEPLTGFINSTPLEERAEHAERLRDYWEYNLKVLNYDPFLKDRKKIQEEFQRVHLTNLSEEEKRKLTTVPQAFKLFLASKKGEVDDKTITTYQNTVNWLLEYFTTNNLLELTVSEVTRLHVASALKEARTNRKWKSNTTYNKELEFCLTIFNWLELEEFILKNPAKGKLTKLRTVKNKHRWYDRETAKIAKGIMQKEPELLLACEFTYWVMIRSKKELQSLRIEDIDQKLKRIRFTSELSKNNTEQFRDYDMEFQKVLDKMQLDTFPKSYFVFGSGGKPSSFKCSHNFFSKKWEKIRNDAGLDRNLTIYSWKYTRIVHMLMLKIDGYLISFMARHSNIRTTELYMRDFDITLNNVYDKGDLTF